MEHSVFALGDEEPQLTFDDWVDPAEEVLRDMELQDIGSTTPDVPQVHGQAQSSGPEAGLGAPVTHAPDILAPVAPVKIHGSTWSAIHC